MKTKMQFDNAIRLSLYDCLSKLSILQFKQFYSLFVHYWVNYKVFISQQNLFNLWCEINQHCHESDDSFPDQYDDHKVMKSFTMTYPYYFIDKLPISLIADLFSRYTDDCLDILLNTVKELYETDIHSAYTYVNSTLRLGESVETLVSETHRHICSFS